MQFQSGNTTLRRYFSGLSEHVFQAQLGVVDPPLVDYVSELVYRFTRIDQLLRVRGLFGRPITQVTEMVSEAQNRIGTARREVHRHIGDFALFWSGVYPESLRQLQDSTKADQFIDYCQQGKRAYAIAATIETDEQLETPSEILQRLSLQFELCAYALREIRREWETGDEEGAKTLMVE
jgi:hypothetical protein